MTYVKAKQPVLIHGPPGCGKTSSVHVIANELDWNLDSTNGSDERSKAKLTSILERARMKSLDKETIYLIDECDGISAWDPIEQLLTKSKHPVVLICNDVWKVPDKIKNRCNQVKYLEPILMAVSQLVQKVAADKGIKQPHFDLLFKGVDFRAGLLEGIYGGARHQHTDNFHEVERMFKDGIIPENPDPALLVWLLDNAPRFLYGSKLIEYILVLSRVDLIRKEGIVDRNAILAQFRSQRSDRVLYPNFLKRGTVLRRHKENTHKAET